MEASMARSEACRLGSVVEKLSTIILLLAARF